MMNVWYKANTRTRGICKIFPWSGQLLSLHPQVALLASLAVLHFTSILHISQFASHTAHLLIFYFWFVCNFPTFLALKGILSIGNFNPLRSANFRQLQLTLGLAKDHRSKFQSAHVTRTINTLQRTGHMSKSVQRFRSLPLKTFKVGIALYI